MATPIEQQIEAAKQRLEELKAKKQKIEAQKRAAEQKRSRKEDTRRKILIGAMILEGINRDEAKKASILADLDKHLVRADDRALFGLEYEPTMKNVVKPHYPNEKMPAYL